MKSDRREFSFKKPGALHKARWMAKLLYGFKICLFEEQISQLPPGTVTTKQQVPKIRAFVDFVALVYVSWWLKCDQTTSAPVNDLDFYVKLVEYNKINPTISASAIKAFDRHLWYLTSEMVPLSLFSDLVESEDKEAITRRLLDNIQLGTQEQTRFGMGYGKPRFPKIAQDFRVKDLKLSDLVNAGSWLLFRLLDIDVSFMQIAVELWSSDADYIEANNRVRSINCA